MPLTFGQMTNTFGTGSRIHRRQPCITEKAFYGAHPVSSLYNKNDTAPIATSIEQRIQSQKYPPIYNELPFTKIQKRQH
jgi:hypothetical protein